MFEFMGGKTLWHIYLVSCIALSVQTQIALICGVLVTAVTRLPRVVEASSSSDRVDFLPQPCVSISRFGVCVCFAPFPRRESPGQQVLCRPGRCSPLGYSRRASSGLHPDLRRVALYFKNLQLVAEAVL